MCHSFCHFRLSSPPGASSKCCRSLTKLKRSHLSRSTVSVGYSYAVKRLSILYFITQIDHQSHVPFRHGFAAICHTCPHAIVHGSDGTLNMTLWKLFPRTLNIAAQRVHVGAMYAWSTYLSRIHCSFISLHSIHPFIRCGRQCTHRQLTGCGRRASPAGTACS